MFSACNWMPQSLQDNPIEEQIEDYIQTQTGVEVDFTSASDEKKK